MSRTFCKKTYIAVISFLLILLLAAMPLTAFAAESGADASIRVEQSFTLDSRHQNIADTFQYQLHPTDAAYPMPEGTTTDGNYYFSISGTNHLDLGKIHYERTGIYTYEVSQVIPKDTADYTYDTEVYTVQVVVKNAADGGLTAEIWLPVNASGAKQETISFANSYDKEYKINTPKQNGNGDTKQPAGNTDKVQKVKTGDSSELTLWTVTAAAALGFLFILVIKRKREYEKSESYMQK